MADGYTDYNGYYERIGRALEANGLPGDSRARAIPAALMAATAARIPGRKRAAPPAAVKPRMTNTKAAILLGLAVIFDVLKFMCTQLWFFGPALIGTAVAAATGSKAVGALAGALGIGAQVFPAIGIGIAVLGLILAITVGFLGWLILIITMAAFGIRFFDGHNRAFLRIFVGFLVSELPLIDALPSFTFSIWSIVRGEYKADKIARKEAAAKQAVVLRQEQRIDSMKQKQILALQAAQAAQEEADAEKQRALQEEYDALNSQNTEETEAQLASKNELRTRAPLLGPPSLIPDGALGTA
jgi:hypothetical protein